MLQVSLYWLIKFILVILAMLWRLFVWSFEIMPWSISSIILGMVNLGDWDADIVDGDSRRLFLCRVLWVWVTFRGSKIPSKKLGNLLFFVPVIKLNCRQTINVMSFEEFQSLQNRFSMFIVLGIHYCSDCPLLQFIDSFHLFTP